MPIGNSFPKNYGGTIMKYYTLEEICSIEYGKDHKRLDDGDIPLFGTSGVIRYVNASLYSGPSVMIPRKGTLSGVYFSDKPFWTIDTLFYTKVNEDIVLAKYLYYYLKTLDFNNLDEGTTVPSLTRATLYQLKIPVPSLKEQEYIVSVLESIDCQIELNQAINDNLEAMARQLYEYWFVQFEFPDENGRPYKSSGGKMEYSHHLMRNTPMGWQIKKLDELADIKSGATPSTEVKANYAGDIVWVTPKDLSRQKSKFVYHSERCISKQGFESCSTSMVPVDSILVSSRAPIGLVSIAKKEVCTNQGFKTIVPKNSLDSIYLYYYVKYQINAIEQLGSGTTFREVSRQDLSAFPILVVGNEYVYKKWVDLQKAIANNQFLLTKETNDLYKLRNTLINLLMNGQVSVNYSSYA